MRLQQTLLRWTDGHAYKDSQFDSYKKVDQYTERLEYMIEKVN